MKIISAKIENFRKIVLVEVVPDPAGNLIEISGENGSGKSSLTDALVATLVGSKDKVSVRRGSDEASCIIDLGDITVEQTWDADGDSKLKVRGADNHTVGQPRKKLESLIGPGPALAFDPLKFMSMKPKDQRNALLAAAGVDFSDVDEEILELYAKRTEINREVKSLENRHATMPKVEVEGEAVVLSDLISELDVANTTLLFNNKLKSSLGESKTRMINLDGDIVMKKKELERVSMELKHLQSERDLAAEKTKKLKNEVDKLVNPGIESIRVKLNGAEEYNRKVRLRDDLKVLSTELEAAKSKSAELTKGIADLGETKALMLSEAKMPIDGMTVDDECVLFGSDPLSEASQSEKIRICTAISAALNPTLRIASSRAETISINLRC